MKTKMRWETAVVMIGIFIFSAVSLSVNAEETVSAGTRYYYGYAESVSPVADRSGRLDTRPLTKIAIANLYQNAIDSSSEFSYEVEPSLTAPYTPGKASAENRQATLNKLNMYRTIAGLTPVEESEEYSKEAQHGAVLLAASNQFGHYPSQPSDMDEEFYKIAYRATSSSNISAGYLRMEYGVDGCIRDSSGSNLTTLGHRRWFLNPSMKYVGFGEARNGDSHYGRYYVYKVFDHSNEAPDYNFVSWPSSGYFPVELVNTKLPWSISVNKKRYAALEMENIEVEITNPAGNVEKFNQSHNTSNLSGTGKYFNVNSLGYGDNPCIICNFGSNYTEYTRPGVYRVKVTGLESMETGEPVTIEYEIEMFSAAEYAGKTELTEEQYSAIEQFVERLYTKCLGRQSDEDGKRDWTEQLAERKISGADVGYGFVFSQEYLMKDTSNEDFLDMLYDVYLGRASDPEGKEYWNQMLKQGVSRLYVFRGFAESSEYRQICSNYGIESGSVALTEGRDLNPGATMFVFRLYEKVLDRQPELEGLNNWSGAIARGELSPEAAAKEFFHSQEFLNKACDDKTYVQILYRTFLDREYDEGGLQDWMNRLAGGIGRDEVLEGFSGSREFSEIMQSYGL